MGDGAPWLALQASERFGSHGRYLLDRYHVCDYFAAVWPGDRAQVHRHSDALKAGRLHRVLEALRERLEPAENPRARGARPLRLALPGKPPRAARLPLRHDLPVGSGLIESAHRHLLQSRLKLAGAWWTRSHAHDMPQLRVTRANDLWDSYR